MMPLYFSLFYTLPYIDHLVSGSPYAIYTRISIAVYVSYFGAGDICEIP